jgi:hypothetical protein
LPPTKVNINYNLLNYINNKIVKLEPFAKCPE